MATDSLHNDQFFSLLISDIKSYSGKDPLLPWLRGIKKMKETLPSNVLKEKLPRFLQKCTQTFESDRRYRNDLRYLRVWLQLMDYVDEPRALLRTMEMSSIGAKKSLFYQAYALYYEKMKKFDEAEKMYHLGVQNLAEPIDELQKSYDQFLHRMERHKNKKILRQESRTGRRPLSIRKTKENNDNACNFEDKPKEILDKSSQNLKLLNESLRTSANPCRDGIGGDSCEKNHVQNNRPTDSSVKQGTTGKELERTRMFHNDDTVIVKFVDTAIVGKSDAENACHHGLVDPTINMKEAMNAFNSMFQEPLEIAPVSRRSQRSRPKENNLNNGFNVFIDEILNESSQQKVEKDLLLMRCDTAQASQPLHKPFQIFVDDEENSENSNMTDENDHLGPTETLNPAEGSQASNSHLNTFVFPHPKDVSSDEIDVEGSPRVKLREDTVIHRFVGSTISDEPAVENVCHHGLVDPTINLKEAMDDINNMFGKPIDFVRKKRTKTQEKTSLLKQDLGGFSILPDAAPATTQDPGGFSILPDDDFEPKGPPPQPKPPGVRDTDFFEPTVFTREAMDDINKMFGMPLDF